MESVITLSLIASCPTLRERKITDTQGQGCHVKVSRDRSGAIFINTEINSFTAPVMESLDNHFTKITIPSTIDD